MNQTIQENAKHLQTPELEKNEKSGKKKTSKKNKRKNKKKALLEKKNAQQFVISRIAEAKKKVRDIITCRDSLLFRDEADMALCSAQRNMCRGLFHLSAALYFVDMPVKKSLTSYSTPEIIFNHRFADFGCFSQPEQLTFESFKQSYDISKFDKDNPPIQVIDSALLQFTQVKKNLEFVVRCQHAPCYHSMNLSLADSKGIKSLKRVAVGNSVAAIRLKQFFESKLGNDTNCKFTSTPSFDHHRLFPVFHT